MGRHPYRIRMICGHIEIRMLDRVTTGRLFQPTLILEAGSAACAECDPAKAHLRADQRILNRRYLTEAELPLAANPAHTAG